MTERLSREMMALRVAAELWPGQVVNLGIGLPTLVANYVSANRGVVLHAENGVLGYGPHAAEGAGDPDLINARGDLITLHPGAAIISHNDTFGIARSGRLDVAVLGALQVSEGGDLANWMAPEKGIGSPGGALGPVGPGQAVDRNSGAHHRRQHAQDTEGVHLSADGARTSGLHCHQRSCNEGNARGPGAC